ncbi:MAG: hypothetical protein JXB47_04880 [Anaerolineae bacterium]|nr:hypothetical protein [Anaerolineae bacterium]
MLVPLRVAAQPEPVRYFDESGHSVRGVFLEFFEANGGVAIFGYSITEAFERPDGRLVQYFQRARFEWDMDSAAEYVQLGALGLALHEPDPPKPPEAFSPAERYFPATGQAVGWEFRAFYEAHGDEAIFGAPITGLLIEDGRTVQYFENARFEWWYSETPARPVRLTDLGTVVFARLNLDPQLLRPAPVPGGRARAVTSLAVRASAARPVLGVDEEQTVFVRVVDQVGGAVADAKVNLTCWQGGQAVCEETVLATGMDGLAQLAMQAVGVPPGKVVVVRVRAAYGGLSAEAETSFRVWW